MNKSLPHILLIKSSLYELSKVEKFLKDIFSYYNYPDECFKKVFLCTSEAVTNAIVHGNKNDVEKRVHLNLNCKKYQIIIKVSDEGNGFNPDKIPNPTLPENILKESGRGLHIMRNIANNVYFNEKGNCLYLEFKCKEF